MLNALQLNWRWNGMIHKSMSAQVGYVMSHMISYAGKLTNIHMLNMFEASSTCKQATPICFAVSLKWKKILLAITGCKCWNVHQHHPIRAAELNSQRRWHLQCRAGIIDRGQDLIMPFRLDVTQRFVHHRNIPEISRDIQTESRTVS